MKYKDWLEEWLVHYVEPCVKMKTLERYEQIIRIHLNEQLGDFEMDALDPVLMQHFITGLRKKGLSVNTVNGIITVLQKSLKTAYGMGLAVQYSADQIQRPKGCGKRVDCFTVKEQREIEKAIRAGKRPNMNGIILCLYTGLRIGELMALEWGDMDLEGATIEISKAVHDGKNKNGVFCRITDTPKTESSCRIIPIPRKLLPVLKEWKAKRKSEYVIERDGKPISVRSYQESFTSLLKCLEIKHRGFHALRHTFATRALECGMDVKTLSEILGHKNPSITLSRYVHSMDEHKRAMMDRVGDLL